MLEFSMNVPNRKRFGHWLLIRFAVGVLPIGEMFFRSQVCIFEAAKANHCDANREICKEYIAFSGNRKRIHVCKVLL